MTGYWTYYFVGTSNSRADQSEERDRGALKPVDLDTSQDSQTTDKPKQQSSGIRKTGNDYSEDPFVR